MSLHWRDRDVCSCPCPWFRDLSPFSVPDIVQLFTKYKYEVGFCIILNVLLDGFLIDICSISWPRALSNVTHFKHDKTDP